MSVFHDNRKLLDAFRAGETAALTQVYWAYVERVEHVVRRGAFFGEKTLSGAPQAALQDLVQETFARAFSERTRLAFDGLRDYQPYLLTICRHTLADWWRKQGREVPTAELEERGTPAFEPEPLQSADPELLRLTEAYLSGLQSPLRGLHDLRYVQDKSQEEAAIALGLSRQNVRTLEEQLRKGLRKALLARNNTNQKSRDGAGT